MTDNEINCDVPSFDDFAQWARNSEATSRELRIKHFKQGLKDSYRWMLEVTDIDEQFGRDKGVCFYFCHTREEAEKIMEEKTSTVRLDNPIAVYDLTQSSTEQQDIIAEYWFEDDWDEEEIKELEKPLIRPKKIYIAAEPGGVYAWDECGLCIGIYYYFEDHPKINEIKQIEGELELWSWWHSEYSDQDDFHWDTFEAKGTEFAERLTEILADTGVKITY